MKFRTKPDAAEPSVIEVIQYCGQRNLPKVLDFILDGHPDFSHLPINLQYGKRGVGMDPKTGQLRIPSGEGIEVCGSGDWIARDAERKVSVIKQAKLDHDYDYVDETIVTDECPVGGKR